jgi:hypothetical protein
MASTVDSVTLAYEETPRPEGAATTTPYQIATAARNFPAKSFKLSATPALLSRGDEIRGIEGVVPDLVDGYQPAVDLSHNAYADDLIFLLGLTGFKGTYTAGDGIIVDPDAATIPAGAARWVFNKRGGNIPKTAQLTAVYADESQWYRMQGAGFTSLGMNLAGELTGSGMGTFFSRLTSDPNISPTIASAAIPFFRRIDLTIPTWLASTGVTSDFGWTITNPLDAIKTPAVQSLFPDVLLNGAERVSVAGTIAKRTLVNADIDALIAASSFAAKVKWLSAKVIGATAYKYTMWLEMPACQIVGGDHDPLSNVRQFGDTLNWRAAYDETAGYDAKFTVVGSVINTAVASGSVGL